MEKLVEQVSHRPTKVASEAVAVSHCQTSTNQTLFADNSHVIIFPLEVSIQFAAFAVCFAHMLKTSARETSVTSLPFGSGIQGPCETTGATTAAHLV